MIKEFPGDTLPLATPAIFRDILESAYRRELHNLFSKNVLAWLWAKDTSLWPAEDYQAECTESNLGWLDLPGQLGPLLARVVSRATRIEPAGFEDVVLVIMGVSGLATESVLRLPAAKLGKRMGIHSPAHHFITRTEENSYLGQLAGEYDFLDSFLDPPGIHGRYSSLIHFNFFSLRSVG